MGGGLGSENGQFGDFAGTVFGMGVAVDQSNGDVFVTDPHSARVQKFNAAGEFLQAWGYGVSNGANERQVCNAPAACQVGIPGAAPGQFDHPTSIAIDNSGGESDGDVYVADTSTPVGGAPTTSISSRATGPTSAGSMAPKLPAESSRPSHIAGRWLSMAKASSGSRTAVG